MEEETRSHRVVTVAEDDNLGAFFAECSCGWGGEYVGYLSSGQAFGAWAEHRESAPLPAGREKQ